MMKKSQIVQDWDVIILGAGPGGYIAAVEAATAGKSVMLVEKKELGGVCLNEGCVPTKTMLHSAHIFKGLNSGSDAGISCGSLDWNQPVMQDWKNKVIDRFRNGIGLLMKKNRDRKSVV
ncbi:MAG: FAD-dependent oxidoreductase, partial [Spirochaetales bacterium]|nr:FAD-dependent oxidoreductase [Spirochaetales bacterium]